MSSDIDNLFVYGVLLDAVERRKLLRRELPVISATLRGYRRARSRYYFVERCESAAVSGVILSGLRDSDWIALDRFEEVPALYTRERVSVLASDGQPVECWIYLPTGWERRT
jgi:gamma-glutamylcyclotransferase (GGCT)/AIG2-like uncharacterized protein YtfP